MMNPKPFQRRIAIVLLAIFLPSLFPVNLLYASNNGPKTPEAASFEPVDATDMVNLLTGQYSYVLPLLNVPSPEGGYPIALGYHAGIALDQEASWAGLGWNVNPGAIDRSINGYPDDYNSSRLDEFFYDAGGEQYASFVSVGYSCGIASVGLGFNWGSNQALGGSMSIGVGPDLGGGVKANISMTMGTSGSSIGIGVSAGGLSVGLSANSESDNIGINAGINSNGVGFGIGYGSGAFTTSFSILGNDIRALGLRTKSKGSISSNGNGQNSSFSSTISMSDYSTSTNSWSVGLFVPTYIGVFSLSFGKQTFKYWLNKNVSSHAIGPLYYNKAYYIVNWYDPSTLITPQPPRRGSPYSISGSESFDTLVEANNFVSTLLISQPTYVSTIYQPRNYFPNSFYDINEVPINGNSLSNATNLTSNNIVLPNYDNFNVQAQGLSGCIKTTIFENGMLFGLSDAETNNGYSLKYYNDNNTQIPDFGKFDDKPNFYFENEISTNLTVTPAQLNTNISNSNIIDYYSTGVDYNGKPRKKTSSYIEYYTNNQINNNYDYIKNQGYLQPQVSGFNRLSFPRKGIGAFKITAVDGKTYHYSLPVYNNEIITRSFGAVSDKSEDQSYMEKRQLEPYATHWLLTAVTGSDFVDNGDGVAGDGDLGYWVSFEYGKWTDAFVWKAPYKKDYIYDDNNPSVKTWIRGRKQLYYLDKVKTRTHTALFVKSQRVDSPSQSWTYNSVEHNSNPIGNDLGGYNHRFTIPSQNQLKLERIILLKNGDDNLNKQFGPDLLKNTVINYNKDYRTYPCPTRGCYIPNYASNKIETAKYDIYDNVIDSQDNWQGLISKALKVIDFTYQPSLGEENSLVLQSVNYKGKSGNAVLPPYKFNYYAGNYGSSYKFDRNDGWGYYADDPKDLSLSKITTPQGGTINVEYEGNRCKSLVPNKLEFSNMNRARFKCTLPTYASTSDLSNKSVIIDIGSQNSYPNLLGKSVNIDLSRDYVCFNDLFYYFRYNSTGTITQDLTGGRYRVSFDNNVYLGTDHHGYNSGSAVCNMDNVNHAIAYIGNDYYYHRIKVTIDLNSDDVYTSGGIRVKNIKVTDGVQNYVTEYRYGQNEDGIGYVSYVPFAQYIAKEVPYSSELPAPRVMYEYVSVSSHGASVPAESKIQYKFNIMKEKDPYLVKYGDFYQITSAENYHINNTANKAVSVGAYTIKDNLASIGQLLEVKTFNGKGHLLSKITNNYYKTTDVIPNNIGITQESYQSYKTVDYTNESIRDKWLINSSTRIKYPNLIKSSKEQKDGYTYTTEFNDYDLISGISKEQLHTSSDGKSYKTKVIPAYTKYPQMGSKVDNINNRNMLSQTAGEYSYILDGGAWKETGVGITTWSNLWSYKDIAGATTTPTTDKEKIWRKHKSYTWNGAKDANGIFTNYTSATDDGFDWTVGVGQPVGSEWKQISEVTLYDHYSMPLEVKDMNSNKAAIKMGDRDTKVMTTGNAGYNEIYFAGAENIDNTNTWLEPEVKVVGVSRSSVYSHTGKYSIAATSSSQFGVDMKMNQHKAGRYKLSVWVHKANEAKARFKTSFGGTPVIFNGESVTAGDWVLKTHYFDVSTAAINPIVCSVDGTTVYFDDLMIRPIASSMTGYVYNEYDELTHIIGNNGLSTRFEYDTAGRLVKTYVEIVDDPANSVIGGFKLKSENKYHYKNL